MAEKKFYLESSQELQRIGLRAQVVSYLIAQGIERGNVQNDLQNKKKVIVAISAKEEREIEETRDGLVAYLNKLHDEDFQCYGQFPTDVRATALFALDNPHPIVVLDLNKLANSLMLEQTSKGVGAMLSLPEALKAAFSEVVKPLAPLTAIPGAIQKLTEKLER